MLFMQFINTFICSFMLAENYRKMEAEKKKSKFHKQTVKGPFIRFHSMLMPEIVRDTLRQSRDDSTLVR